MQSLIIKATPDYTATRKPKNKIVRVIWEFIKSWYFEGFIMCCIIFNIFTMALTYETASNTYNEVLDDINLFFTSVFICELILKITALGFHGYFRFCY